jgi:hypothetical protein
MPSMGRPSVGPQKPQPAPAAPLHFHFQLQKQGQMMTKSADGVTAGWMANEQTQC